jgi:hypothetical protein
VVHFKPDGTDPKPVTIPSATGLAQINLIPPVLTPDDDAVVFLDGSVRTVPPGGQLTVLAIGKDVDPFVLKDYYVQRILPVPVTVDGGKVKVYFTGQRIDAARTISSASAFVFDVKTHAVEPLTVPDRHVPVLVLRDGTTAMTYLRGGIQNAQSLTYPYFVVKPGSEPVEFHLDKEPIAPTDVRASQDGSVVLIHRRGMGLGGRTTKDMTLKIIDLKSKAVTEPKGFPENERIDRVVLSPDGKRIAYVTRGTAFQNRFARVYVAAVDGSDAKEVYKSKSMLTAIAAFDWR